MERMKVVPSQARPREPMNHKPPAKKKRSATERRNSQICDSNDDLQAQGIVERRSSLRRRPFFRGPLGAKAKREIHKLCIQEGVDITKRKDRKLIQAGIQTAKNNNIDIQLHSKHDLNMMAVGHVHQGFRLDCSPLEYREMSRMLEIEDHGVIAVARIYKYCKAHGLRTKVIAASFRNVDAVGQLPDAIIFYCSAYLEQLESSTEPLLQKLSTDMMCKGEGLSMLEPNKWLRHFRKKCTKQTRFVAEHEVNESI